MALWLRVTCKAVMYRPREWSTYRCTGLDRLQNVCCIGTGAVSNHYCCVIDLYFCDFIYSCLYASNNAVLVKVLFVWLLETDLIDLGEVRNYILSPNVLEINAIIQTFIKHIDLM